MRLYRPNASRRSARTHGVELLVVERDRSRDQPDRPVLHRPPAMRASSTQFVLTRFSIEDARGILVF
jgi:hypothetical protein